MEIQLYTDLEDSKYVFIDLSSLIHAYEYATKKGNHQIASQLLTLFSSGIEHVRIAKNNPIYTFLKSSLCIKEDEITWKTIKESYLIARLQNNTPVLRILGKILGHWEQYVLEQNEQDGLFKELTILPEEVRHFVLKYHDVSFYEEQKREQVKLLENHTEEENRSVVEISYNNEKIYKKAA